MRIYKVLESGHPFHGGSGVWPLPVNGQPGEWLEVTGPLVPCKNGLHLCKPEHLLDWLGPDIYKAEYEGEHLLDSNKIVARRARLLSRVEAWNERTARLFACDCAERALRRFSADPRSWEAIRVARAYAMGQETLKELAAARAAAWATTETAAYAAEAPAEAAAYAAEAAARAPAYAAYAAWAAARAAAYAAEAPARAAAYVAEAAARAAAYAAEAAARAAERQWQAQRLLEIIET